MSLPKTVSSKLMTICKCFLRPLSYPWPDILCRLAVASFDLPNGGGPVVIEIRDDAIASKGPVGVSVVHATVLSGEAAKASARTADERLDAASIKRAEESDDSVSEEDEKSFAPKHHKEHPRVHGHGQCGTYGH